MAICVLSPDQKKILYKKISRDLYTQIEKGTPFSLKDYVSSIYNFVMDKKKDEGYALAYAGMVPSHLALASGVSKKIRNHIGKGILDVYDLEKQFEDTEYIAKYLGKAPVDPELRTKFDQEVKRQEADEKQMRRSSDGLPFSARPNTLNATTGDELDINMAFSYNFIKFALDNKLLEASEGLHLTAMNAEDVVRAEDTSDPGLRLGAVQVITDEEGNPFYFDSNYNKVSAEEGKLVFFRLRENLKSIQTVEEMVKTTGLPADQVMKMREEQAAYARRKKDFVLLRKGNKVIQRITGGSYGIIDTDYSKPSDLSALEDLSQFKIKILDPKSQTLAFQRGDHRMPVTFNMKPAITNQDLLDAAVDIIYGDVVDDAGKKSNVLDFDRQKFVKVFFGNVKAIQFVDGQFMINGAPVSSKDQIREALTYFIGTKTGKAIPSTINYFSNYSGGVPFYERKTDGSLVLRPDGMTPVQYRKFIQNNAVTYLQKNAQGEVKEINGYLTFEEMSPEMSKIETTTAVEVAPVEEKEEVAANDPAEFINHSGGAVGADSMFDTIGQEYGVTKHMHYYYGSKTPKGNVLLTDEQVAEGVKEMEKAAKILNKQPKKQATIDLLARNWFQVKNSTQVVAIAAIDESMKFIEGGTGWAVAMAQANNKEIHVFNLKDNTWYKWDGKTFVKSSVPVLAKNFAGIGSRQDKGKMTPESTQAIRDVYENTFGKPGATKKTEVKPVVKKVIRKTFAKKNQLSDNQINKIIDDENTFNKLKSQKLINEGVTREQLIEARDWYESTDLFKKAGVTFAEMFSIVNSANPDSVATFTEAGITLFKGSDYTDLYHEAWHVFTKMFLPQSTIDKLEKEVRDMKGSFVDYSGNTVSFSDADPRQIEEYLAEKFRAYMLSGGKKTSKDAPVQKSIFKKILEVLNILFNFNVEDITLNEQASSELYRQFERLRVGRLTPVQKGLEASRFTSSDKIKVFNEDNAGLSDELGYGKSMLLVESIDALFSEYVDDYNNKNGKKYTASLLSSPQTRADAYNYAYNKMADKLEGYYTELESLEEGTIEYNNLADKIETLQFGLDEFSDAAEAITSKDVTAAMESGKGLMGYHLEKSKYLSFDEIFAEMSEDEAETATSRDGYAQKSGNEIPMHKLADKEVLYLVRSLYQYEKGKQQYNELGFPKLLKFETAWNKIQKALDNISDANEMYKALLNRKDKDKSIAQLISKLGHPDVISSTDVLTPGNQMQIALWTKFRNAFSGKRIPLVQLTVDITKNDMGKVSKVILKPGNAKAEVDKIARDWDRKFTSPVNPNKYISKKVDQKGEKVRPNFLKINQIVEDFKGTYKSKPIEFLRSLGMLVSDDASIVRALKVGDLRNFTTRLYDKLKDAAASESPVYFNNPSELVRYGTDESNKYDILLNLEARNSEEYGTAMVSNAKNDPQYELSLRSTVSQMIDAINNANTYEELIADPKMSHLDIKRNPFIKNLFTMKALFGENLGTKELEPQTEGTTKAARYVLENSSGVSVSVDEVFQNLGISSSEADPITQTLQNFYTMLIYGVSEGTRHSDKSTTYLYRLVFPQTNKMHYINMSDFTRYNDIDNPRTTTGNRIALSQFMHYLNSEVERINRLKAGDESGNVLVGDKLYKEVGTKLVIFQDILKKTTREKIEKYTGTDFPGYLDDNTKLKNEIEQQILDYFDAQVENFRNDVGKINLTARDQMMSQIRNMVKSNSQNAAVNLDDNVIDEVAFRTYVLNDWIHKYETTVMFYGDPALYNMKKEEFHKRNAGVAATGTLPRTDQSMLNILNTLFKPRYQDSEWFKKSNLTAADKEWTDTMNSAVLEDTKTASAYLNTYIDAKISAEEKRLGRELTKKEKDDIKEEYSEYGKMKEGDAQGWISFDSYRALLNQLGKWSPYQESLYNKILNGEDVSSEDVSKFFPVKKMQYWGPLKTSENSLPVVGFHKFSLLPLVPNLVKGTNLEVLHNKMVSQGIDYATFGTGSKINTITTNGKIDKFYEDNSADNTTAAFAKPDYEFTKNVIFLDYFKDQLETADGYKGKVIFPTQLRKLIEEGLMDRGVPIDYTGTKEEWDEMDEDEKLAESDLYKKVIRYEQAVAAFTDFKIKELEKDADITYDDEGNAKMSQKLIEFVKKELTRQDLAEHEIDFIKFNESGSNLTYDLSIHPSAEKMEKLLSALVYKRIVRQKVNGEALIQVSGVGFEMAGMRVTKNEIDGTNQLAFYRKRADGTTAPMQVKIALQGDFKKLLRLKDDKGVEIGTLDRLNRLLKDEKWVEKNRKLITITGVRIPVQGLNSMEFAEVAEFLPETSGNIVILPAEIVAKSGGDFDIDKLTFMMPNISEKIVRERLTNKLLKELQETYPDLDFSRDNVDTIVDAERGTDGVYTITPEDQRILDILDSRAGTQVSLSKGNNAKGLENDLISSIVDILSVESNFVDLITPNGTFLVKPLADELAKSVRDYNPMKTVTGEKFDTIAGTRIFELGYNRYKQNSNNIGKKTLGLGAVDNTYNTVFNRIGAYMSLEAIIGGGKNKYEITQRLLMPHNQMSTPEGMAISLSDLYSQDKKTRISTIISQMMNGWVDVAKDSWIFDIQGNPELSPSLLFLIQAGVPLEQAVYFMSQPIIRDYVEKQRLIRSTFAQAMGEAGAVPSYYRVYAREKILSPLVKHNSNFLEVSTQKKYIYKTLLDKVIGDKKEFTLKELKDNVGSPMGNYSTFDYQVFLHFIEIEEMAKATTAVKLGMNFDTARATSIYALNEKLENAEALENETRIPSEIIEKIESSSPIGSFKRQSEMIEILSNLFPLRTHPELMSFISGVSKEFSPSDLEKEFPGAFVDKEQFINALRNDFTNYAFQQFLYNPKRFDKKARYRSLAATVETTPVTVLKRGAYVENGVLYVDFTQMDEDFNSGVYSSPEYTSERGLAQVKQEYFSSEDPQVSKNSYYKFVYERETLRYTIPYSKYTQTADFEFRKSRQDVNFGDNKKSRLAYEEYLRDNALLNTYNIPFMFYDTNGFAAQVARIETMHPEEMSKFRLFSSLQTDFSGRTKNLRLSESSLDTDAINAYHEELQRLSDPSVQKVADPLENDRISRLFSLFPVFAFLQAGQDGKNAFSLARIVNTGKFSRIMDAAVANALRNLEMNPKGYLNKYWYLFSAQYRTLSADSAYDASGNISYAPYKKKNIKKYFGTIDPKAVKKTFYSSSYDASVMLYDIPFEITVPELITDKPTVYLKKEIGKTLKKAISPNTIIVFDDSLTPYSPSNQSTMRAESKKFSGVTGTVIKDLVQSGDIPKENTVGIITKTFSQIQNASQFITDAAYDANVETIEKGIQELIKLRDDTQNPKSLVFSQRGYGLGLLGYAFDENINDPNTQLMSMENAPAPKTFVYLSRRLREEFGYVNPMSRVLPEGREEIAESQPITDARVREQLRKCFSKVQ